MIKLSKNIFGIKKRLNDLNNLLSSNVCCFTGYRPQKCPWGFNEKDERFIKVKEETRRAIKNAISIGYNTFLCGMAIGFDMMCAEIVLELKKNDKNIRLIGAGIFVLFFTVYQQQGVYFKTNDYEYLESLPIKKIEIVIAKFVSCYILSFFIIQYFYFLLMLYILFLTLLRQKQ